VNVVVYVSDALRADHLGCYGARFVNTRTIDEFAAAGLRFDQAISAAPWTAPSMT
jgi:arylsulfatase A-like enzyme